MKMGDFLKPPRNCFLNLMTRFKEVLFTNFRPRFTLRLRFVKTEEPLFLATQTFLISSPTEALPGRSRKGRRPREHEAHGHEDDRELPRHPTQGRRHHVPEEECQHRDVHSLAPSEI